MNVNIGQHKTNSFFIAFLGSLTHFKQGRLPENFKMLHLSNLKTGNALYH